MRPALWDMHVHLDFISNAPEVIREAEEEISGETIDGETRNDADA